MNWDEDAYKSILKTCSKNIITQDGVVLKTLIINIRDSAMNLSLLPYYALYCRSAKEYLFLEDSENDIENEVKDIRDGLKIFTGRYSKSKSMVRKSDDQQNKYFRSDLRFPFTKRLNIHLNLGVYFNDQGKVVFDTQLANFFLNMHKGGEESFDNHAMMIGQKLGSEIAEILVNSLEVNDLWSMEDYLNDVPQYGYIDFNTNRCHNFFNQSYDKETNLVLLHMLSMIGFVNNLLVPVFQTRNIWLLRILYITIHNTWFGIKKLKQHFEQNNSSNTNAFNDFEKIEGNTKLFSSSFRNCMMHYGLIDKNDCPIILQECYDSTKPLYGLVESCFNGMSFDQYYDELYGLSQRIEEQLLSYFNIDLKKIHWDWN
mgnify:CR=1 FL=1